MSVVFLRRFLTYGLKQCSGNKKASVSLSVHGFRRSVIMNATADHPEQKYTALTLCTQADGIRTITLNYVEKRNALSLAMLESIKERLTKDVDSPDLRVIILRANGPVFSSGHNLKELDIPVPVVAEVKGLATAAGCQLVASCDIAVASEKATFATPGVNSGLFCSTPGVAVARSVPKKVALHMLLTAEPLTAREALMHGLVSRVVQDDQLEIETIKVAKKICQTSRPVIALGKQFFYRQILMPRNDAYREASRVMVDNLRLDDAQEGITAFIEKRAPQWKHTQNRRH